MQFGNGCICFGLLRENRQQVVVSRLLLLLHSISPHVTGLQEIFSSIISSLDFCWCVIAIESTNLNAVTLRFLAPGFCYCWDFVCCFLSLLASFWVTALRRLIGFLRHFWRFLPRSRTIPAKQRLRRFWSSVNLIITWADC